MWPIFSEPDIFESEPDLETPTHPKFSFTTGPNVDSSDTLLGPSRRGAFLVLYVGGLFVLVLVLVQIASEETVCDDDSSL